MAAVRKADAVWEGDLMSGKGMVSAATSQVFRNQAVTWASRTEGPAGRTSPEELLASAHASCFSMALAHELAEAKTPAQKLEVSAEVTFDKTAEGFRVTTSALTVRGAVRGIDEATFRKHAESAKDNCPVSKALQGNVKLSVQATLAH
jgi:osmotically inducible protein OsmC